MAKKAQRVLESLERVSLTETVPEDEEEDFSDNDNDADGFDFEGGNTGDDDDMFADMNADNGDDM